MNSNESVFQANTEGNPEDSSYPPESRELDRNEKCESDCPTSERRFRCRIPLTLQVKGKVILDSGASQTFQTVTQDVGYHGVRLKLPRSLCCRQSQMVKLKIRLYRGDFFLRARGQVCWVGAVSESASRCPIGIRIVKMRRFHAWCERINQCVWAETKDRLKAPLTGSVKE